MRRPLVMIFLAVCLVGCQSQRAVVEKESPSEDPLMKRFASNYKVGKGEDGAAQMQSSERSTFEGRNYSSASQGFKGKSYTKKKAPLSSWNKNRNWSKLANNDTLHSKTIDKQPWFIRRQQAQSFERSSRWQGQSYQTSALPNIPKAGESRRDPIGKPSDTKTDRRRKVYITPPIRPWKEQQEDGVDRLSKTLGRSSED